MHTEYSFGTEQQPQKHSARIVSGTHLQKLQLLCLIMNFGAYTSVQAILVERCKMKKNIIHKHRNPPPQRMLSFAHFDIFIF